MYVRYVPIMDMGYVVTRLCIVFYSLPFYYHMRLEVSFDDYIYSKFTSWDYPVLTQVDKLTNLEID